MSTRENPERGSGTVVVLAIIACALMLGLSLVAVNHHLAARAHLQAVADIAAIHAAGSGSCAAATQAAAKNSAGPAVVVGRCELHGLFAQVELVAAGPIALRATSRAGPIWHP